MSGTDRYTAGPKPMEDYSVFRFNVVGTVIALLAAVLIGWGISMIPDDAHMQLVAGLSAGVMAAAFLVTSTNAQGSRSPVVIRATAWSSLVLSIIVSACMAAWCTDCRYYILVNGLWLLIFAAVTYRVAGSGQ